VDTDTKLQAIPPDKLGNFTQRAVIRIKILIMGHFLLTFRISMSHSLTFFVNISDFNGTFSDGM